MSKAKKKKKGPWGKIFLAVVLVGMAVGGWIGWQYYQKVYSPNVVLDGKEEVFLYIPSGSDEEKVISLISDMQILKNEESFRWMADQKNYRGNNVVSGKYAIANGMSNNDLMDHLRAGNGRLEVSVTFNQVRTVEELAGKIGGQIEADSLQLIEWLQNPDSISKYGFTNYTILTFFLPNTYRMQWDMTAPKFMRRMAKEYKGFWNQERKNKAAALKLSQSEVATLASIVQAEQQKHTDEQPRIAGLYLNRIKKGMRLESDPTVIYGVGDFTITRVLNKHLQHESPYNTYLHTGLPPGPINLPQPTAIDAVLNAEKHDYIFMCAKPKTGGKHNFAKTYSQHLVYARQYWDWLNSK